MLRPNAEMGVALVNVSICPRHRRLAWAVLVRICKGAEDAISLSFVLAVGAAGHIEADIISLTVGELT